MVDGPVFALRALRRFQFFDDLGHACRRRADRARAVRATQRPHPAHHFLRPLARAQRQIVFGRNQRSVAYHHFAFSREIQRHHWYPLQFDVAPHVQLGPVRQREHAHAFPLVDPPVVQVPQLRPLVLRIPLPQRVAERIDPFLGPRLLFFAPRSAQRRVEPALLQRIQQRPRLQRRATLLRPQPERVRVLFECLRVFVHDQLETQLGARPVAELDHLPELVRRVHVQQRPRRLGRIKRLQRQPQHHRRVLADRVQHHRPREFGRDFSQDVNAFRFERLQISEPVCQIKTPSGGLARIRPRTTTQHEYPNSIL